ncbi:hypothetical protein Mkiyose1665_15510 [Mycobacterium kiyosense]|uniref:Uncharacterized protein n=1 Tax=Mycobacterium kiyosense TaxID=2871094 RepID=A0A9P3Q622_9MYCO|nr:hypothetical protein [Mycobacterium kiyosense]GLB83045.1 hypothetical protein SRL2020028_23010 [Mycobacterium kiyosense]GLB94435.1 hypothetical protein SRL2020226_12110 [Mycobacterium kiyosense]GLD30409.1 hypothetical protein Mkiyose1413_22920 [Mycobacterium kiyosense]GLD34230.1 hypothetical protein Mkiyose1595_04500 [Mycobacterium kiyosense]GLD41051.1 hypothetical protein Mkiyose1665_15510 [Mycobacterium kiyosense]
MDHSPVRAFSDGRVANRVCMWVNKFHEQTTVTASYQRNPIAYESIARYRETMRSVFVRVADGRPVTIPRMPVPLRR